MITKEEILRTVYGKLTPIRFVRTDKNGQVWLLRCACGNTTERAIGNLRARVARGICPACDACGQKSTRVAAALGRKRAKRNAKFFA